MRTASFDPEDQLVGLQNFTCWDRALHSALACKHELKHILRDAASLTAELEQCHVPSDSATVEERRAALEDMEEFVKKRSDAYSTVYKSLSRKVQAELPFALSHTTWSDSGPHPGAFELYEHLKQNYGHIAFSRAYEYDLWVELMCGRRVAENEDPDPMLNRCLVIGHEIQRGAEARGLTAAQVADSGAAYAMLHRLPPSFAFLLREMLTTTPARLQPLITLNEVSDRVGAVYRSRRQMRGLKVDKYGHLVERGAAETLSGDG